MSIEVPSFFSLCALSFLVCLAGGQRMNGETIRVAGSDHVHSVLRLGEYPERIGEVYEVQYKMTGSLIGLFKLQENLADVAIVMQTDESLPPMEEGLARVPLGFWGLYFAVREENPLNELSEIKLSEVLRKARDGLKSEWGLLLPGEPKWTSRLIFITMGVREDDPAYPILIQRFFSNETPEAFSLIGERIDNPYIAGTSNLLVMSRVPLEDRGLRPISIIPEGRDVGFSPSPESLYKGDYPFRSRLMIVTRDPKDPKVREFVRAFFKNNHMKNLIQAGLVPVPENVRNQALLEFDLDF